MSLKKNKIIVYQNTNFKNPQVFDSVIILCEFIILCFTHLFPKSDLYAGWGDS